MKQLNQQSKERDKQLKMMLKSGGLSSLISKVDQNQNQHQQPVQMAPKAKLQFNVNFLGNKFQINKNRVQEQLPSQNQLKKQQRVETEEEKQRRQEEVKQLIGKQKALSQLQQCFHISKQKVLSKQEQLVQIEKQIDDIKRQQKFQGVVNQILDSEEQGGQTDIIDSRGIHKLNQHSQTPIPQKKVHQESRNLPFSSNLQNYQKNHYDAQINDPRIASSLPIERYKLFSSQNNDNIAKKSEIEVEQVMSQRTNEYIDQYQELEQQQNQQKSLSNISRQSPNKNIREDQQFVKPFQKKIHLQLQNAYSSQKQDANAQIAKNNDKHQDINQNQNQIINHNKRHKLDEEQSNSHTQSNLKQNPQNNGQVQVQSSFKRTITNPPAKKKLPEMEKQEVRLKIKDVAQERLDKQREFLDRETSRLPIFIQQHNIVSCVQENQVIIISGETGCGKSTQVPKFLYRNWERNQQISQFNMICTQPRRMAAINLAKRVAKEMGVNLGKEVGYQIGMESCMSEDTKITYMTNGIFLQHLVHNDEFLAQHSHVILDEVHERDLDSDFIMITLKHLLHKNMHLSLILMSATINAEKFAAYFSREAIEQVHLRGVDYEQKRQVIARRRRWNNKATGLEDNLWETPEQQEEKRYQRAQDKMARQMKRLFAIKQEATANDTPLDFHTAQMKLKQMEGKDDDIDEEAEGMLINCSLKDPAIIVNIKTKKNFSVEEIYMDKIQQEYSKNNQELIGGQIQKIADFVMGSPAMHMHCVNIAIDLVDRIVKKQEAERLNFHADQQHQTLRQHKNILIFMPGFNEIFQFKEKMIAKLPYICNQKIKIILSTNIAESSVTLPDVAFVIDFCLGKQLNFNSVSNMEKLELVWVSKASCKQRGGRTGRICSGVNFRLIPEQFYNSLPNFCTPEMRRVPLGKVILRIKMLNEKERDNPLISPEEHIFSDPPRVLGRALDPPYSDNIGLAWLVLQDAGAITIAKDGYHDTRVTHLGKFYSDLPCDIKISKLIMLGFGFNCLNEALTLAAILCQQKNIFVPIHARFDVQAVTDYFEVMWDNSDRTQSDMILMIRIYTEWARLFYNDDDEKLVKRRNKAAFRRKAAQKSEVEWCKRQFLDLKTLREIMILRTELQERLSNHGINEAYFAVY